MFTLTSRGRLLTVEKPLVMGIINITPDSFYSGSRMNGNDGLLAKAEQMISDGATILDIGGQSTRPGSEKLDAPEELRRVLEPVRLIHQHFPNIFISIDTYYASVAKEVVEAGATIVNDISAGNMDDKMIDTVAALNVPYILMHMLGTPSTMQQNPQYKNVTTEVFDFFCQKIKMLQDKGIHDIIVDPGFGFGKTIAHNFELLNNFQVFKTFDKPLLLGISRKSSIYKTLGVTVDGALNGTTVLNTIGLMKGASILRVHDVKEAAEAIKLVGAMKK